MASIDSIRSIDAPRSRRALLVGAAVCVVAGGLSWKAARSAERTIAVVARKFVFLPNEITLKVGEPVVLEFTAPEVVMGFNVPELKLRTDIVPGQVARLRVVPERAGSFPFLCDVFCGDGHEGMGGTLIVKA